MLLRAVFTLTSIAFALPAPAPSFDNAAITTPKVLAQFSQGTWIANLALRSNGAALLSVSNTNSVNGNTDKTGLYQVEPGCTPVLLYQFEGKNATFGIAEVTPDVFAVSAGLFDFTRDAGFGNFSIYLLDLNDVNASGSGTILSPKRIDVKSANTLNSVRTLNSQVVLSTDSGLGQVWSTNVSMGESAPVLKDISMATATLAPGFAPFGVDGSRVANISGTNYFYYTNPAKQLYARVPIAANGAAAGAYHNITVGQIAVDNFDLNPAGTAYAGGVTAAGQGQFTISQDGAIKSLDNSTLAATATQFSHDFKTLYYTTSGEDFSTRTFTQGARMYSLSI